MLNKNRKNTLYMHTLCNIACFYCLLRGAGEYPARQKFQPAFFHAGRIRGKGITYHIGTGREPIPNVSEPEPPSRMPCDGGRNVRTQSLDKQARPYHRISPTRMDWHLSRAQKEA